MQQLRTFTNHLLAAGISVAILAGGMLPAPASAAPPDRKTEHRTDSGSAPARSYAAPARSYAEPQRSYAAPERTYAAPERAYAAPVRAYSQPARSYAEPQRSSAAPKRAYAAPVRTYSEPARSYAEPQRSYAARERAYAAPVRTYSEPARSYAEPQRSHAAPVRTYSEPARSYAEPQRSHAVLIREYAAPARAYRAPEAHPDAETQRAYRAPQRSYFRESPRFVERPAIVHHGAAPAAIVQRPRISTPFVERLRPQQREASHTAPFVQYVRVARQERFERVPRVREIVEAPVLYHPAYLTGRVIRVVRNSYVVLAPPTGQQVVVRCACTQVRPMQYVAVPATYSNGSYYAYGYSPQYYPQVAQWYSNYYGAPVQYQNGYYVPQYPNNAYYGNPYYGGYQYNNGYANYNGYPYYGGYQYNNGYANYNGYPYNSGTQYYYGYPYNGSYPGYDSGSTYWQYLPVAAALLGNVPYLGPILDTLSSYASPYGTGYGSNPYYGNTPYYGNAPYYGNGSYYGSGSYYGTPYDQCYNAPYNGNGACAPVNGYGAYSAYGLPIGEQQVQGVVVGRTGSALMVLGANGLNPILIDATPALRGGYSMNGPIAIGQVISAYGYYTGNTFVATALV